VDEYVTEYYKSVLKKIFPQKPKTAFCSRQYNALLNKLSTDNFGTIKAC
jgi:hypothetical protein